MKRRRQRWCWWWHDDCAAIRCLLASADRVRVTVRFYLVVRGRFKCHPGKFPAKNRYEGYCGRRNVSVHMSSTHVAGLPGWLRGWPAAHFGPLRQRCRPAVPEVDPKWTRNDTLRPTSEPALLRPTSTHFGDIPREAAPRKFWMLATPKPMKPWEINVPMTQRTTHFAHMTLREQYLHG